MSTFTGNGPGSTVVDPQGRRAPAAPPVSVHLQRSGPWQIIVVDGEMDLQVLPLLPDLRGLVAARVVFDLHGVTFMDASALGALVERRRWVTRSGGCMRLVAHSGPVLRLLVMTGTGGLFSTFDTLDRALHTPVPPGPDEAS
jgi:anti-sigma B factor antagonist